VNWLVRPLRPWYQFSVDGFVKQDGARATFRIPPAARGKRLACAAGGKTGGGGYGSPLSPRVRVAG
jgi:hypothetical protein